VDIGLRYMGMGHVQTIAMSKENNNEFFLRHDGGSNDYDRKDNYEFYSNPSFKPEKIYTIHNILNDKNLPDIFSK